MTGGFADRDRSVGKGSFRAAMTAMAHPGEICHGFGGAGTLRQSRPAGGGFAGLCCANPTTRRWLAPADSAGLAALDCPFHTGAPVCLKRGCGRVCIGVVGQSYCRLQGYPVGTADYPDLVRDADVECDSCAGHRRNHARAGGSKGQGLSEPARIVAALARQSRALSAGAGFLFTRAVKLAACAQHRCKTDAGGVA